MIPLDDAGLGRVPQGQIPMRNLLERVELGLKLLLLQNLRRNQKLTMQ